MNTERMEEISRETGLCLDEIAEHQLDYEPLPEKYENKRMRRSKFVSDCMFNYSDLNLNLFRIGITGVIAEFAGLNLLKYSENPVFDYIGMGLSIGGLFAVVFSGLTLKEINR